MMNEETETWPRAASDPLQHLKIAIRIAESSNGTAADKLIDPDRLVSVIVIEIQLGLPH